MVNFFRDHRCTRAELNLVTKMNKSTPLLGFASVIGFFAFAWPLFISAEQFEDNGQAKYLFLALMPVALLILIIELTQGDLDVKSLAFLGVLTATGAALRIFGAGAIGVEPIWFLIILGGRALGKRFGFLLGLTVLFASALLTGGAGPWLAFQMMAAAWIGWGAGALPKFEKQRVELIVLAIYGFFAGLIFGALMDLQLWPWLVGGDTQISFVAGAPILENLHRYFVFHFLTAMAWDIPRAILTAALITVAGKPILNSLRRSIRKANFVTAREMAQKAAL
jgi:energy-coupling factor transport system substrate-specific component